MSCNTATGEEAAAVLKAIPNKNFMLNWDPGNAAAIGSKPYPTGYELLPKDRVGHCHCKDVVSKPDHKYDWAPVGGGMVDWVGQLQALQRDGFRYGLSLETHWRGQGRPRRPRASAWTDSRRRWRRLEFPVDYWLRREDRLQENFMVTRREFLDALAVGAAGLAVGTTAKSYAQIMGLMIASTLR